MILISTAYSLSAGGSRRQPAQSRASTPTTSATTTSVTVLTAGVLAATKFLRQHRLCQILRPMLGRGDDERARTFIPRRGGATSRWSRYILSCRILFRSMLRCMCAAEGRRYDAHVILEGEAPYGSSRVSRICRRDKRKLGVTHRCWCFRIHDPCTSSIKLYEVCMINELSRMRKGEKQTIVQPVYPRRTPPRSSNISRVSWSTTRP